MKAEQSEPRALAGTTHMILALSWKSYPGQTGKKRERHIIRRRAPRVHRVPETCLVKTSVSQGEGKVGLVGVWLLQSQENARDEVSYRKLAEIWTADRRTTQHLSSNLKTSLAFFIIFWQKYCQGKSVQCFPWPSTHKRRRTGDQCTAKGNLGYSNYDITKFRMCGEARKGSHRLKLYSLGEQSSAYSKDFITTWTSWKTAR